MTWFMPELLAHWRQLTTAAQQKRFLEIDLTNWECFGPLIPFVPWAYINMTVLDLAGQNLDCRAALDISRNLRTNTTLQTLNLRENNIKDMGGLVLAMVLMDNTTLQHLDVSDNYLEKGMAGMAAMLVFNTGLKILKLANNDWNLFDWFALAVRQNKTLLLLDLDDNCILVDVHGLEVTDQGQGFEHKKTDALEFAAALATNTTLKALMMNQTYLTNRTVRALAKALHTNCSLQILELSSAIILTTGWQALADMLEINTTLQHLDISDNCNDANDIGTLSRAVGLNRGLTYLNMECLEWTPQTALVFIAALSKNTTLQHVHVSHNSFVMDNIKEVYAAFGQFLAQNTSLKTLSWTNFYPNGAGWRALADGLGQNRCLEHVTLDLLGAEFSFFEEALAINPALVQLDSPIVMYPALEPLLKRNQAWKNKWWTCNTHSQAVPRLHQAVITVLLAASRFRVGLPVELWCNHILPFLRFYDF